MRYNYLLLLFLTVGCMLILPSSNFAQRGLLNKIKNKAEDKLIEKVFGEGSSSSSNTNTTNGSTYNGSTSGYDKGKKLTPPDVSKHINEAEAAVSAQSYAEAKFAIQQAMTGVELEIGYDILDNAPESVAGMTFNKEEDQVVSSGYGFVGLVIGRRYEGNKKEMTFQVMNNNAMANLYSGMLTNSNYSDNSGEQKTINLEGNEGVLRYESGGYELGVPFGQTSILILSYKGFKDEAEVMEAAKTFKVNEIKRRLGEQ